MPRFDLSLEDLRDYRPSVAEPADFESFWATTLSESRQLTFPPVVEPVDSHLDAIKVFDVTFAGFNGDPVKAWLLLPATAPQPLPAIIEYVGYGGGRGLPHEHLRWVNAGYAHFVMDNRGQGSYWGSGGETPDPHGSNAAGPGVMTRGILDPNNYYFRRLYTDAVLATDAVRSLPEIDPERIIVNGISQGGGLALAVAGLVPDLSAVLSDVPFLSHFERAIGMTGSEPYEEVSRYLAVHRSHVDKAYHTLSYFDGVNFARRATCPAFFSVALCDQICPPSTVFASINHYPHEARYEVYPFNGHEGGGGHHWPLQVEWLKTVLQND